jgi:hypothetical protein
MAALGLPMVVQQRMPPCCDASASAARGVCVRVDVAQASASGDESNLIHTMTYFALFIELLLFAVAELQTSIQIRPIHFLTTRPPPSVPSPLQASLVYYVSIQAATDHQISF